MRQMEDAAMKAYSLDIANCSDITSRSINNAVSAAARAAAEDETIQTTSTRPGPSALPARAIDPLLPPVDILEEEERAKRERMKKKLDPKTGGWTTANSSETGSEGSMWCEAKSDEGHTYYWNVKTGSKCLRNFQN